MESHVNDAPLQESVEVAEKFRSMQAPNREGKWSRSQNPREMAMSGPRFEQTIMKLQVCDMQVRPQFFVLVFWSSEDSLVL